MAAYLITGRTGSGKSAVCRQLRQLGLQAFDGDDVEGLAHWVDLGTGQPVNVDYSRPIDTTKVDWYWDETVLRALLSQNDSQQADLYLCGSASNQLDSHKLFDKVFILTLPSEQQIARIMSRPKGYGKYPEMHSAILEDTATFTSKALQLGGIPVDATPPVTEVTKKILEETGSKA